MTVATSEFPEPWKWVFVPGGFSARDYGMVAVCSLFVCRRLHHEISSEVLSVYRNGESALQVQPFS